MTVTRYFTVDSVVRPVQPVAGTTSARDTSDGDEGDEDDRDRDNDDETEIDAADRVGAAVGVDIAHQPGGSGIGGTQIVSTQPRPVDPSTTLRTVVSEKSLARAYVLTSLIVIVNNIIIIVVITNRRSARMRDARSKRIRNVQLVLTTYLRLEFEKKFSSRIS